MSNSLGSVKRLFAACGITLVSSFVCLGQEKGSDASPSAATKPPVDRADALPAKLAGRWRTDDGRFANTHEVIVESVDGTTVKGMLIVWSGRCNGKPARFVGTYDGLEFTIATGSDSPCSPIKYSLKRQQGGKHLFEGTWEISDFRGTAYFDPK